MSEPNFNLPPGVTDKDIEEHSQTVYINCPICGRQASEEEQICVRCQRMDDERSEPRERFYE